MIAAALLPITIEDYLGKYAGHAQVTPGVLGNVVLLLQPVNAGLLLAQRDGIVLRRNTVTGSLIGGSGNGGFRPDEALDRNGRPVGAEHSWHKRHLDAAGLAQGPAAIDLFDPLRELAAWSLGNATRLHAIGILAMERPQWTPSWCHWQTKVVGSRRFAYVPSSDAPLAAALPGELEVAELRLAA